jgi:hypothetical protein
MVARSITTVTARERLDRLWLESTFVAWSWVMRTSDRSPSIVPPGNDQDVYLVLDDFGGRIGQAWRETNADATRLETVVADLLDGQYSNPVRVVGFNTAEGWSRDVSEDVARELSRRCAEEARDLPSSLEEFVDRYQGQHRAV